MWSLSFESTGWHQGLDDKAGLQWYLFELSRYWITVEEIINAKWRPRKCWLDPDCNLENNRICKVG